MTLQEIIDDLKYYGFTSEAGTLESCEAFRELERIANDPVSFLSVMYTELKKLQKDERVEPVGYIVSTGEVTPQLLQWLDQRTDAKIAAALDKYSL